VNGDGGEHTSGETRFGTAARRISGACAVAAAFGLGIYLLLNATRPNGGLISFSFLLVLPTAISAFLAYICDPLGVRRLRAYLMVPVWLVLAVVLISALVLHEGVICILILSPLWLGCGLMGAVATYSIRRRLRERGRVYGVGLLALPLLMMQIEPHIPLPVANETVHREILVHASPKQIWPLLRGIPDVRPDEGRWNVSQDIVGIPRPQGARLIGDGIGAVRHAHWGRQVAFDETISRWAPEHAIGWRFIFNGNDGWQFTDRHLRPDSPYFRVLDGGYTMAPAGPGLTRVMLDTRYAIRTPVNGYSRLWGELFLGDLETNLLAIVRDRAERRLNPAAASS
jgi:hypothetical protein